jgi:hypothetical protein
MCSQLGAVLCYRKWSRSPVGGPQGYGVSCPIAYGLGNKDIRHGFLKAGVQPGLFNFVLKNIKDTHSVSASTHGTALSCTHKHARISMRTGDGFVRAALKKCKRDADRVQLLWAVLLQLGDGRAVSHPHVDALDASVHKCAVCQRAMVAHRKGNYSAIEKAVLGAIPDIDEKKKVQKLLEKEGARTFTPATGAVLIGEKILAGVPLTDEILEWLRRQKRFDGHYYAECLRRRVAPNSYLHDDALPTSMPELTLGEVGLRCGLLVTFDHPARTPQPLTLRRRN